MISEPTYISSWHYTPPIHDKLAAFFILATFIAEVHSKQQLPVVLPIIELCLSEGIVSQSVS